MVAAVRLGFVVSTVAWLGCGATEPPARGPAPAEAVPEEPACDAACRAREYEEEGARRCADVRATVEARASAIAPSSPDVELTIADGGDAADAGVGVVGSLSRAHIQSVVRAHLHEVRACYEAALDRYDASLEGRLMAVFIVGGTGTVLSAGVSDDTIGLEPLACCIEQVILGFRFDSPTGGGTVRINYPFALRQVDP
jgi:hypothetical protein